MRYAIKPGDRLRLDRSGHDLNGLVVTVHHVAPRFNLAPPGGPRVLVPIVFVTHPKQPEPIGIGLSHIAGTIEAERRREAERLEAKSRRKLLTPVPVQRKEARSGVRTGTGEEGPPIMAKTKTTTTSRSKQTANKAAQARAASQTSLQQYLRRYKEISQQMEGCLAEAQNYPQLATLPSILQTQTEFTALWNRTYSEMLETVVHARGGRPASSTASQANVSTMPAGGRQRRTGSTARSETQTPQAATA